MNHMGQDYLVLATYAYLINKTGRSFAFSREITEVLKSEGITISSCEALRRIDGQRGLIQSQTVGATVAYVWHGSSKVEDWALKFIKQAIAERESADMNKKMLSNTEKALDILKGLTNNVQSAAEKAELPAVGEAEPSQGIGSECNDSTHCDGREVEEPSSGFQGPVSGDLQASAGN